MHSLDELERIQFDYGGYHTSLEQVEAALQDRIDLLDPKTPITAVIAYSTCIDPQQKEQL